MIQWHCKLTSYWLHVFVVCDAVFSTCLPCLMSYWECAIVPESVSCKFIMHGAMQQRDALGHAASWFTGPCSCVMHGAMQLRDARGHAAAWCTGQCSSVMHGTMQPRDALWNAAAWCTGKCSRVMHGAMQLRDARGHAAAWCTGKCSRVMHWAMQPRDARGHAAAATRMHFELQLKCLCCNPARTVKIFLAWETIFKIYRWRILSYRYFVNV